MRISANLLPKDDTRINIVISTKNDKTASWLSKKIIKIETDENGEVDVKVYNSDYREVENDKI